MGGLGSRTHTFLSEADIAYFRPLILQQYLAAVDLACVRDEAFLILGFLGTYERRIEMLFVRPDVLGQGIGRRLVEYAITAQGVSEVDVNEQNPAALAFYRRLGFVEIGRSETDSQGKPFPLRHLRRF